MNTVAHSIGEILGRKPQIDYLPPRAGDIRDSWARIDTARELLGFEPSVQPRRGPRAHGARRSSAEPT